MKTKETFASLMQDFTYRYDSRTVFDDFLTMTLCAFSQNPLTGKSHDEDLYIQTIEKYKDDKLRFHFPKLLSCLTNEMEELIASNECPDVLGKYYEANCAKKGMSQFFTPWHICQFMTKASFEESLKTEPERPLRILDPACGSGRFTIASFKEAGPGNEFYGIDIDMTCVKMAAINLFLNGIFHSEVMCGNALLPDDFHGAFRISFLPFGVFRIKEKEHSRLWNIMQETLKPKVPVDIEFEKPETILTGDQLTMF